MVGKLKVDPADIAVAGLYDGMLPSVFLWLEALGLCGPGEAPARVSAGEFALGGRVPVNTHGGSVSAGRLHGHNHVSEAVLQVTGRAGERQVPDARLALVTVGQAVRPVYGPGGTTGAVVLAS
jgi:acetyl-CoA acetyltransferase